MTDYSQMEPRRSAQESPEPREQEIEFGTLWNGVRRHLPVILLATGIISAGVYVLSRGQPDVFEATASLVTTGNSSNLGSGRDSVVTASPLPEGALQEALNGPTVLGRIITGLRETTRIPQELRTELADDLQRELQLREVKTLQLQNQLDFNGNGIYSVTARAGSPVAAKFLADLSAQALLDWDRGRALNGLERASQSLQAQLAEIDRQLAEGAQSDLERQTLVASRASLQRTLAQVDIQAKGATGSLELVSPAVEPLERIAPKPTRNAILAGLLTLLLGGGLAALRTVTDRTARSEDDLLSFGLPTLGSVPKLRRRDVVFSGIVRAARQAGLYEALGFLRVNLLTRLGTLKGQRIMISSTAPGEGKSSLTATLADTLANSGLRVLIIDADMRRGTQQDVWDKYESSHKWLQLSGEGGARTLQEALRAPGNVQVIEAEPGVHVLPAGPGLQDSMGLLNRAPLGQILDSWSSSYDLVLIDSPPMLALADGLILGRYVDQVLIVVEEGKTSLNAVKQTLRRAGNANVPILGFILNKVSASSQEAQGYGYGYGYAPRKRGE
ncbi:MULTISPECIES: polysaccharide biosynthesis tyrosine autokinase [unclassified Deinococcus]|uniref:polysaccharide biosynthesis tyrosine autokinase n=1 Tax=unclassified Deinococcus TaxID=2623546 RepID=UPI001C2F19A2|nr:MULTISPECIES: polysaccharide biosynthesis tyrosine autokinase [unclassified Deinococcus]MDK2014163.1 AAA family ATPase [Deinococcus sp. 43]